MVNKGANDVRDEIESAIYQAAVTILAGSGFSFGVPSRAKGNQLYVPELDRIVLKDSLSQRPFASSATCRKAVITARILGLVHELCLKGIHVTKRDLFYTDVKLFEAGRHALRRWTWLMSSSVSCAACSTSVQATQHMPCRLGLDWRACRTKAARMARSMMWPACWAAHAPAYMVRI